MSGTEFRTVLQAIAGFSTATLHEAAMQKGALPSAIKPLVPHFRICGPAFTVKTAPGDNRWLHQAVYEARPGDVLIAETGESYEAGYWGEILTHAAIHRKIGAVVIDNAVRLDATVWGDLLTTAAHRRGVPGTVIHGVCRDVARSIELKYPIFSRGNYMRTGKERVRVDAFRVPVSLGQVCVEPKDLIVGDADGLVVIPRIFEQELLAAAQRIHEAEQGILTAIQRGNSLAEARREFGYYELSRRK